jgi:uncharacterized protein
MKLRNAGLLVVVLAAAASCDQSKPREKPAVAPVTQGGSSDPWNAGPPAKDPLKKPLFWKLEKDGKTSYLLGTMHMGVDPTVRLPDVVWQKLDAVPTFAMETDLSEGKNLDTKRHDGKNIKDELGPERWKKLEQALGPASAKMMLDQKPMIPATMLSMRGLPSTPPMDGVLAARAGNHGKKIVYLEPLTLQMSVLEKWMDTRMLGEMLDDLEIHDQRIKEMFAAYIAGDGDKLVSIQQSERELFKKHGRPDSDFDDSMNDLLYKRNASWIDTIEKIHGEGGAFIAVGAAHALGDKSVLDLLGKRGFTITRITP